jgi:DNA-binding beta-propeller fold protein YncE
VIAGNRADRTLSLIDIATRSVIAHLPLALEPRHFCFKSDGGILYVTGPGLDAVSVIYPYRHIVAETLLAGRTPGAMAVTASAPELLFVANAESGDVTILRIRSSRVAAVVAVGAEPGHITITPDNQYALVLNRRSGDVAVIDVAALSERRGRPAPPPLFTMIPVGLTPVSAVFHA